MKNKLQQSGFRTHSANERGVALMVSLVFFLAVNILFLVGVSAPVFQDIRAARTLYESRSSFAIAEGSVEDVTYRLKTGMKVDTVETLVEGEQEATTTVTDIFDGKDILAVGDVGTHIRKVRTTLIEGSGVAFNFGVQSDVGGIVLENNSSVRGNVFSNGTVLGSQSNLIKGDAISAGPAGLVDGIHATGTARAHTITDSVIDGDAYYQVISDTTVGGTLNPGSADQPTTTLPISDELVAQWEADAAAGGTISSPCPYVIDTDITIGPVKITCDVTFEKSPMVDIAGMIWIMGDLTIRNSPTFRIDSSIVDESVVIIADNPSNRITSSKIDLDNANDFLGNGTKSYIMLLSQNESAELGGTEPAVIVSNQVEGEVLVYAAHGEVVIRNNASLREVTAYRIRLQNIAEVIYSSGLASTIFTSGPSGGFELSSWREVE